MTRNALHFGSAPDARRLAASSPSLSGVRMVSIGQVIGVYRVERVRSESLTAVVYEASHLGLGCGMKVAIKVLRTTDASAAESLLAAVRRIGRFGGPHVVRIFDVGVLPTKEPYVVMDLLEGQTIADRIEREGAFPIAIAADVAIQLCRGLAEPHRHSIVHGNVRPSSVIVRPRADGGLAAAMLGFDRPGACSAGYASPEQLGARADVDARTDVWAIGILLYEMLTAGRAFPVRSLEEMRLRALSRALPSMTSPRGAIPDELSAIVRRCTQIHRTSRFASADDLAGALAPFAATKAAIVLPVRPKLESTLPSSHPTTDDEDFKRTLLRASAPATPIADEETTATRSALDLRPPTPTANRPPGKRSDSTPTIALPPASAELLGSSDSVRTIARAPLLPPPPLKETVVAPPIAMPAEDDDPDSARTIQRTAMSRAPAPDSEPPRTISEPPAATKGGATPTCFHGSLAESSSMPTVRPVPTPTGPFPIPAAIQRPPVMATPALSPMPAPAPALRPPSAPPASAPSMRQRSALPDSSDAETRVSTVAMARPSTPPRLAPTRPMTAPLTPPSPRSAMTRAAYAPAGTRLSAPVAGGSYPPGRVSAPVPSDAPVALDRDLLTAEVLPKRRWAVRMLMGVALIGAVASLKFLRHGELVGMATAASTPMTTETAPASSSARLAPLALPEPGLLPAMSTTPRASASASGAKAPRVVPAVRPNGTGR